VGVAVVAAALLHTVAPSWLRIAIPAGSGTCDFTDVAREAERFLDLPWHDLADVPACRRERIGDDSPLRIGIGPLAETAKARQLFVTSEDIDVPDQLAAGAIGLLRIGLLDHGHDDIIPGLDRLERVKVCVVIDVGLYFRHRPGAGSSLIVG